MKYLALIVLMTACRTSAGEMEEPIPPVVHSHSGETITISCAEEHFSSQECHDALALFCEYGYNIVEVGDDESLMVKCL